VGGRGSVLVCPGEGFCPGPNSEIEKGFCSRQRLCPRRLCRFASVLTLFWYRIVQTLETPVKICNLFAVDWSRSHWLLRLQVWLLLSCTHVCDFRHLDCFYFSIIERLSMYVNRFTDIEQLWSKYNLINRGWIYFATVCNDVITAESTSVRCHNYEYFPNFQ